MRSVCSLAFASVLPEPTTRRRLADFSRRHFENIGRTGSFKSRLYGFFLSLASVRSFRALGAIPPPIPAPEICSALQIVASSTLLGPSILMAICSSMTGESSVLSVGLVS